MWRGGVAFRVADMKTRWPILVGTVLIVVGLVIHGGVGRIFSTYLLDLVVGTLATGSGALPPQEYSWGVKTFGNMQPELLRGALGAGLIGLGYLRLIPALAPRASGLSRVGVIAGCGLLVLSGLMAIGATMGTIGTFRTIAEAGAVDPMALGEDLPVRMGDFARYGLLAGMALLVAAGIGIAVANPEGGVASGRRLLAWLSGAAMLGFAGCLLAVATGPLTEVLTAAAVQSPGDLARKISTSIQMTGLAGGGVLLAGVLGIVAAVLPAGPAAAGER